MFKKLFICLVFFGKLLFAEISVDAKNRIDGLLNKTNSIAKAHISISEARGVLSSSVSFLQSSGYLDSNFTLDNLFGGQIEYSSINSSTKILDLNTSVFSSTLTTDERLYFLSNFTDAIYSREIYEKNGTFWVKYFYSSKALSNAINRGLQNSYIGDAPPTSYITPSTNQTWWDSKNLSYNVKKYDSGFWVNEDYSNQNISPLGVFENLNTVPLNKTSWAFSQVIATEQNTPIICRNGSTYNQLNNRCEAYTSDACDGNGFDTGTGRCYKAPISYCNAIGYSYYDASSNRCFYYSYASKITTTTSYTASKNLLWTFWLGNTLGSCSASQEGTWVAMGVPLGMYQCLSHGYYCPSGGSLSGSYCYKTVSVCPPTHPTDMGNGTCLGQVFASIPYWNGDYYFADNSTYAVGDAWIKAPSCGGKSMTVSPYASTPHYGWNGICYSDTGLYCQTYAGSTGVAYLPNGKQITCFDSTQNCNNYDPSYGIVYDFSGASDKCSKFNYSCSAGNLYGLSTSPVNNSNYGYYSNSTSLFNNIINKDAKTSPYTASFLSGSNVIVNDNQGAMCVEFKTSTLSQPTVSPTYSVGGIEKSGF